MSGTRSALVDEAAGDAAIAIARKIQQLAILDETDALAIRVQASKLPKDADILIAFATTPGFVSWRNSANGSWFVQAICQVFAQYAATEDVLSLLTMVGSVLTRFSQKPRVVS